MLIVGLAMPMSQVSIRAGESRSQLGVLLSFAFVYLSSIWLEVLSAHELREWSRVYTIVSMGLFGSAFVCGALFYRTQPEQLSKGNLYVLNMISIYSLL